MDRLVQIAAVVGGFVARGNVDGPVPRPPEVWASQRCFPPVARVGTFHVQTEIEGLAGRSLELLFTGALRQEQQLAGRIDVHLQASVALMADRPAQRRRNRLKLLLVPAIG